MDSQRIYTNGHSLGGDYSELLAVRAVLIEFVDHLLSDALGPCAGELLDLLCVGKVGVKGSELAATVPEENHQVVGFTLLQLLQVKRRQFNFYSSKSKFIGNNICMP